MANDVEGDGGPSPDRLSRRALLRRAGQGAVVAGLAAWVVPEIVVASPAGAQPLSAPPGGGGGPSSGPGTGDGGSPTGPGGGPGPGTSGGGSAPGTGGGGSGPAMAGGGSPTGPETGGQGPGTSPSGSPTPSATGDAAVGPAAVGAAGGHGSLAFTGFDPATLLGVGGTLVAGGWTINRWASRHERLPEPEPPAC